MSRLPVAHPRVGSSSGLAVFSYRPPRGDVRQPIQRARDAVLRPTRFDDVELQAADDADDRVPGPSRHEDLHSPSSASCAPLRRIACDDVGRPQDRKLLRRKLRNRRKLDGLPAYSVSPIAMRPGLTTRRRRPERPREPSRDRGRRTGRRATAAARVEPRVDHEHVLRQPARADAQERDAIAVARVHVRLDLEDEPREVGIGRLDVPASARRGPRRRRERQQRVQKRLDAEVVQRAAEEDRCLLRVPVGSGSKRVPAP